MDVTLFGEIAREAGYLGQTCLSAAEDIRAHLARNPGLPDATQWALDAIATTLERGPEKAKAAAKRPIPQPTVTEILAQAAKDRSAA